uniref:Ig-like domain-containing protein n=1 Tax=Chelonoidis abingdonii TaxID=106734 RepID=A0A8C0J4V5_CHEAB
MFSGWVFILPGLASHIPGTTALPGPFTPGVSNCNQHPLEVSLLPPSLEDLYIVQNATISCLMSGMETPRSLEVSWNRGSGGPLAVVSRDLVLHEDGTYSATSILRVCVEEWQTGEDFTCTVKHQDFPSAIRGCVWNMPK